MSDTISLSFKFAPQRSRRAKPRPSAPERPKGSVPRVAKLLALAHHFEDLRRQSLVEDYADLARLGGITRARVTQIMSLLNLAPDIQEDVLYLPRTVTGRDPVTTRDLMAVAQVTDWTRQRKTWAATTAG